MITVKSKKIILHFFMIRIKTKNIKKTFEFEEFSPYAIKKHINLVETQRRDSPNRSFSTIFFYQFVVIKEKEILIWKKGLASPMDLNIMTNEPQIFKAKFNLLSCFIFFQNSLLNIAELSILTKKISKCES